ncbi:RloB domain-containing protein [Chlorobium sp. BLA1]|uniref:RloB family protein n=1 Tax=Candidatus Chlorobium masyuteum TaxID=2716876 RepID=UPI001420D61D|nr:RloB family protein [Candidatus Chlorobium masyuteum]NHQ60772.1 RloB domain-containing protein [Candidatus Chlorobium masyuteum]
MKSTKSHFHRPLGEQRYKKMFVIAAEGARTENEYFDLFNNNQVTIKITCLKNKNKSAPKQILCKLTKYLSVEKIRKSDEAWIVVDRDRWKTEDLNALYQWSIEKENYGFCLSNPKFEYWLLLHFENSKSISSPKNCENRLKRYLLSYDKGIERYKFNSENILIAIERAKKRDIGRTTNWPENTGTTVYKLVERILDSIN